jgi:hypothetical protein
MRIPGQQKGMRRPDGHDARQRLSSRGAIYDRVLASSRGICHTPGAVIALKISLYFLLLGLALLPVLVALNLPLYDYPNHIARVAILTDLPRIPELGRYYLSRFHPFFDLAIDILLPPLIWLTDIDTAARLFLVLTFLLITTGVIAINHVLFRDWSVWPFVACLFLLNTNFIGGLINYLFGLGCALWVLAAWIQLRGSRPILRWGLFSIACSGLLFIHFYCLALYAVAVAVYESVEQLRRADRLRPGPDLVLGALQFLAPAALFLLFHPSAQHIASFSGYDIRTKIFAPANIVHLYNRFVDLAVAYAVYAVIVFAIFGRWLHLHRNAPALLLILIILFYALPDTILGSHVADFRLPVACMFFFIAFSCLKLPHSWRGAGVALLCVVMFGQSMFITTKWRSFDRIYAIVDEALAHVDPGARVTVAIAQSGSGYYDSSPPLAYAALRSIKSKHTLVNGIFVQPEDDVPLRLQPEYLPLAATRQWHPVYYILQLRHLAKEPVDAADSPFAPDYLHWFDYLLVYREEVFPHRVPAGYRKLFQSGDFTFYDLRATAGHAIAYPARHRSEP